MIIYRFDIIKEDGVLKYSDIVESNVPHNIYRKLNPGSPVWVIHIPQEDRLIIMSLNENCIKSCMEGVGIQYQMEHHFDEFMNTETIKQIDLEIPNKEE